jgi:biotin-dependent carboxylase-like uncharacterized protein
MIEIVKAPPHAAVFDLGFPGGLAFGLPPGGAMDDSLLPMANRSLGNSFGDAAIEWALGPMSLRLQDSRRITALGQAKLTIDGKTAAHPIGFEVARGSLVELIPARHPLFSYFAVEGGIVVDPVLGSRSTYLPGGFGGYQGRRLRAGDRLPLGVASGYKEDRSSPELRAMLIQLASDREEVLVRVTRGPQWDRFAPEVQERFLSARFTVDRASDRMGFRLTGPGIAPRQTATLPSEAAYPGAIQVPDNGQPIVLMPDGPTVGGYPKIAVVLRTDLRLVAQSPPGTAIRFEEVGLAEARAALRTRESWLRTLEADLG